MTDFLIIVGVLGAVAGFVVWGVKEGNDEAEKCGIYPPAIVQSKLDGRRGMVVAYGNGVLWVRFAQAELRTDTRVLGTDGALASIPYARVRMQCFEVEAAP